VKEVGTTGAAGTSGAATSGAAAGSSEALTTVARRAWRRAARALGRATREVRAEVTVKADMVVLVSVWAWNGETWPCVTLFITRNDARFYCCRGGLRRDSPVEVREDQLGRSIGKV
jgi:hypothetical protein